MIKQISGRGQRWEGGQFRKDRRDGDRRVSVQILRGAGEQDRQLVSAGLERASDIGECGDDRLELEPLLQDLERIADALSVPEFGEFEEGATQFDLFGEQR